MGMISRFTEIMSANINSVLEKSEKKNADKLLKNYLSDLKQDLSGARAEAAGIIAEETAAKRDLNECMDQVQKYERYAAQALKQENEADARRFLQAKADAAAKLAEIESDCSKTAENSQKMREMVKKLENDVEEAEDKVRDLTAGLADAKRKERAGTIGAGMLNPGRDFDDLCDTVERRIDEATALEDLKGKDADLEAIEEKYKNAPAVSNIEDELDRLKAEISQKN